MLVLEGAEYEKVLAACPRMCTFECVNDKGNRKEKEMGEARVHARSVVFVVRRAWPASLETESQLLQEDLLALKVDFVALVDAVLSSEDAITEQ